MSKIVFFCIPAYGHTNPTLGVVEELTKRGHEVWYYSFEEFRTKIEKAGARFVACDEYNMELKLSKREASKVSTDIAFSTQVLVETTLALEKKVCRDMQRLKPDCIVADSMAVWGKVIAGKLGIPFVSSTTTFAFNQYSAKIMKQSIGQMLRLIFSLPKINKNINRLRKKGYQIHSFLDLIKSDENADTIVYTSAQFQPCADTFSSRYAFVGPSVLEASKEIEKTREKLVYISMGTVNNELLSFYKNCIAALKDSKYQVIISTGNLIDRESLGELPENISVFSKVDQIAVLEKADVFLTHCGMNSVNESLYDKVPMVMYPQTSEQGGVAARVAELGAGVLLEKNNPAGIRRVVEQVMNDKSYLKNAAKISEGFHKCPSANGAADKILEVCNRTNQ